MQRIASIYAYDALDNIIVKLIVRAYKDYSQSEGTVVLERSITLKSWGEHDDTHWVLGILDDLVETL